nr:F-box protein At5g41720 [Nicotiana tomentosiformis]
MASSELPSDMAFEILTPTSLETLDACKVVNKTWKNMTYKLGFMQVYCHRTNNILGYFVQGLENNKYVTEFVSMDDCSGKDPLHLPVKTLNKPEYKIFNHFHNTKIEASSKQGILCCVRRIKNRNHMYYICKPSTREWKVLPNPKTRYQTVKVALVVYIYVFPSFESLFIGAWDLAIIVAKSLTLRLLPGDEQI